MHRWKKLGKIYDFKAIDEHIVTHASNPLAVHLHDDIYRIFFSGRSIENKSSVGFVDIDIVKCKVVFVCDKTVLEASHDSNSYFSHGISVGCSYATGLKEYILFMGWQVREGQHWRGEIGRLEVIDGGAVLAPVGDKPFIAVGDDDPVSLSYPWVITEGGLYKMWYGSTVSWDSSNGEMIHVIKYASSDDGISWNHHGIAIPFEIGVAQAFSRPCVIHDSNGYHMWYSYRSGTGEKYRIGYAFSLDGLNWNRFINSGINVSKEGWDSDMVCYPFVLDHKGHRYMLYNGNDYGKTGFGLAVLEHG